MSGVDNTRCLQAWMRLSSEGVLLTDTSNTIIDANVAACRIFGVSLDKARGSSLTSWLCSWGDEQDRVWADAAARVIATSLDQHIELRRASDDVDKIVHVRIAPLSDAPPMKGTPLVSTWQVIASAGERARGTRIKEQILALLDRMPEFVCVQAQDGTIRYANRVFRTLFGDPDKRYCFEIFAERSSRCPTCPFDGSAERGKPTAMDLEVGERMCRVSDATFVDIDGESLRLITGVDVTNLKEREEHLSRRARQLEETNAELEEANVRIQRSHATLSSTNTSLAKMIGKLGQVNRDLEREISERKQVESTLRDRTQELELAYAELEDNKAKRQEAWAAAESTNKRLEDAVTKLAKTNAALEKEVKERRGVEASLCRSEEWTRSIINASKDAMITINHKGLVTVFNSAAEKMFGYSAQEMLGNPLDGLMPREYRQAHAEDVESYFRTGKPDTVIGCTLEVPGLRRDGKQFPMEISLTAGGEGDGRFVLGIMRDITERQEAARRQEEYAANLELVNAMVREANEQLRDAYGTAERKNQELVHAQRALQQVVKDLEQSNNELDAFAYIASHDLKEPLRGIHNYAAFLHEDYRDKLDDEGRDKLETLQRLTQRLEMFIDSLLHFSRVGRVDLAVGRVNLNVVLDEIIDSLRISLDEKGVALRIPQPLPTVECDRVRVAEVFRNLLSNAMKYNDKPVKWIEIGSREARPEDLAQGIAPKTRVFYVQDNGIGVPEKHIKTIFRMFKRLHGRDKFGGGTGAGIAIVKKIIERHRGRIWVQSTPGEGTTFFFTLGGSVAAAIESVVGEGQLCGGGQG